MSKRRRAPGKPYKSRKPKPLSGAQTFLVELKKATQLLREVLLEVKELLIVLTLIAFFLVGVWESLAPKVGPIFQALVGMVNPP